MHKPPNINFVEKTGFFLWWDFTIQEIKWSFILPCLIKKNKKTLKNHKRRWQFPEIVSNVLSFYILSNNQEKSRSGKTCQIFGLISFAEISKVSKIRSPALDKKIMLSYPRNIWLTDIFSVSLQSKKRTPITSFDNNDEWVLSSPFIHLDGVVH